MTTTLEQELEALIESADYRVTVYAGDNYLSLTLLYMPKLVLGDFGVLGGAVAKQHWICRNPQKRWRKAKKWVMAEIKGHRELIQTVGQA